MFRNLLTRTAPGPETKMLEAAIDPKATWAQVILACNRIARLLPVADSVRADVPSKASSQRLLSIIKSIQAEDNNFVTWISTQTEATLRQGTEDSSKDVKESLLTVGYIDVYRTAQIILLQTLLILTTKSTLHADLDRLFDAMDLLRTQADQNTHEMVNQISFSAAEVLSNLEEKSWRTRASQDGKATAGYVSIWPLNIALSVKTLSKERRGDICG